MAKEVKAKRPYNGALRAELAQVTRSRILEAGRRLLLNGTYGTVTMYDIAGEAGVAYQTVYAIFGTKLRLAHAIIEAGFPHVDAALMLLDPPPESAYPELQLRTVARVSRLILEPCAELLRFMQESGDPTLIARYHQRDEDVFQQMSRRGIAEALERSGRLREGLSRQDCAAVGWTLCSPENYIRLVFQRHWTPDRYEQWLGDALISTLLQPGRSRERGHAV